MKPNGVTTASRCGYVVEAGHGEPRTPNFPTRGGGPAFFAEGMYRKVDATIVDDDVTDPDSLNGKVGLDLSGVAVNTGVLFRF